MSSENIPSPSQLDSPAIDYSAMHNELGVYHYDEDNITVISQPTFDDTLEAIHDQPPAATTILTPELALLDDAELDDFTRDRQYAKDVTRLMAQRRKSLHRATKKSDNTVLMGAPLDSQLAREYNNGLLAVRGGKTTHEQRKKYPGLYEEQLNQFSYKDQPTYYRDMGRTALICSELLFTSCLDASLQQRTDSLLVPAAWGVPTLTPEAASRHGSRENYDRHTLTSAVTWAARDLPHLQSVYIADRSIAGSRPQSGRITINRT